MVLFEQHFEKQIESFEKLPTSECGTKKTPQLSLFRELYLWTKLLFHIVLQQKSVKHHASYYVMYSTFMDLAALKFYSIL